ncbi:uncharacterized threonine-rich GPI-anchored glycoprotein PJ4664.02-like isoform X2 [Melanaphis sacchari]|uniref:uncharacterized threonine-rich GPI-anchored glycoprotein PJ4664.02-like isoform X2 n=1 Tax=Melanaphis sacchari TaxID=742174 RepID=UPI000DC141D7|nr:uncharacterized threonine-rich GPI-anchored glycoprotein PJ4664.02-like isoform X2 [Melanaphis sacchari]
MSITYSKVNLKKRLSISNKYSEKYPSLPITYLKKNMMKKFSFSNRYFKDTVKKELTLLNTCLENSVEKELLQPNKYSVEVIKNRLNLPKANLNLSIKNIVSVPNTHFEVTIDEKCIKNVLNINSKMVVKKKKKSLRLNPQQITTDEPIVSILDEATTTKITPQKKKFLVGLGLSSCVHSEKKNVRSRLSKKRKIHPKAINIDNKEKTKQSNHDRTSSEKVKRTYPSKKSNCKKDDQKHTVIPTLISAEKPLGSSINIDHSCIPECSSCNRKFDLLETPFHIAQIKNPDKQKACLENASHLIGSDSCLCTGCYQAIEKRTSIKNLKKRACIIMACEQTVSIDFNSKWMDIIKSTLLSNKITLRVQTKEEGAMHKIPVCNAHYEQILFISQCQLCGNRTIQKYKLHKSVVKRYQLTLDRDEIPITIKYDILICKPCHIYLLLPRDKSTKMSLELAKHCNASKTRIINHCRLKLKGLEPMKLEKCEINTKKTEGDDQLLTVKSLPTKKSNIFTEDSSITFKPVSSVLEFVNTTIAITTNTIRTRPTMTRSIITTPEAEKPMSSVLTKSTKILSSLIKSTTESTSIQPSTTVVTTTIETAPLMTTRTMIKAPISTVLTSTAKNLSALKFNQKTQLKFLDKRPPVPRNKKYILKHLTVTKNYRNHHMPVHKLTLLDGKIKILVKKPKTRVDKSMTPVEKSTTLVKKSMVPFDKFAVPFDRPMTQVHKSIIPVGKPTIQVDKLMTPVEKPTIPVDKTSTPVATLVNKPKIPDNKPIIVNHRSKPVFIPVLKPFFTSKFSAPKNYVKTPDLVPPIKLPTEIKTDQSLKNTLDLRPTSPHIEFSKSNRRQASPSILSSSTTTPDIIQLYKNLKTAYPSGMEFVNHLLKLESCRNLGDLTVKNNKTIDHQRKSYTKNTSPRIIHSLQKPKEYKMPSHINGHCNDLTNIGYLSNKCEVSEVDKNSDSLIIPVKTTSKSSYKPEQESISPKINVVHKPSLLHDGDDNEKHVIALRISTTAMPVTTIVTPVTTNVTPVTTATIKALTNIISAASPISSTIVEEITASEELTTIEMASLATNTTDLITAVADSTTTVMDTEISTITDTVAVTSDITSTVNDNIDNSTIADSTVVEEYKTLTMITTQASTTTNTASEVSSTIVGDSITDIATTVIDDSASANINSESSTITNAITVEIPTSTITVTDVSTTSCVSNNISDITTTTAIVSTTTITASTISNTSEFTSNKNTEDKLVPTGSTESIVNNISNISTSISSEIVKASPAKLLSLPSSKASTAMVINL